MILAAAVLHAAAAAQAPPPSTSFLDGVWEGELKGDLKSTAMRLHIQGNTAQVYARDAHDRWEEVKAGKFRAVQHNFNAVVFASDSAGGNCWDETWSFAVALDNANQLLTKYSRVVSNVRCMQPQAETFGSQAAGLLKPQPTATAAAQ